MKNFTNEFKAVFAAASDVDAAKGAMQQTRLELALAFHADGFNPDNAIDKLRFKEKVIKAFPKGTGKDADQFEKAAVSNIRQCVSCYKKGRELNIPPTGYENFGAWRADLYPPSPETKEEIIKGWIDNPKIDLNAQDLIAFLQKEYCAIGQ